MEYKGDRGSIVENDGANQIPIFALFLIISAKTVQKVGVRENAILSPVVIKVRKGCPNNNHNSA
ncbi:hypothetical protein [Halonatronum saccharophilum]|uniref:hypothetical protein n=1 Tax=Halonatronum saccharophilum TaxID=150060 RepID=UPI000489BBC8